MFKLRDLLGRLPRFAAGATAVELGCWPGGWLQVLAERVGPGGRVLGLDVQATDPVEPVGAPVSVLELDFTEGNAPERIASELGRPADLVLSDAAPKLTGIKDLDRAAVEELCEAAIRVASRVLRPGGGLVLKGFPGPEADRMRGELRKRHGHVNEVRPEGRRSGSSEFYWVIPGDLGAGARGRGRRRGRSRRGTRA